MKKLILCAALALAACAAATASPVALDRAKTTATSFMKKAVPNASVKNIVAQTDAYYIFNLNPTGWVIVAADDVAMPILGYSPSGSLSWNMLPPAMQHQLRSYGEEIGAIKKVAAAKRHSQWSQISSTTVPMRASSRAEENDNGSISPLISVKWNQPSPYNKYCPSNGSGTALVGCVAVSMSQAMSVQRYPIQPQGAINYACANYGLIKADLDAEQPYDWDAILNSDRKKDWDEAARLMYHAGISVSMDYGIDGSGIPSTQVGRIAEALVEHFAYDPKEVKYYWRANYGGDWNSLILNELNAGRAVVYNAVDRERGYGHSFNIDGYDAAIKQFHLNWGWGGIGNGYFPLSALSDAALNMNYNDSHVAVIGIGSPDRLLRSMDLSEYIIDEKLPTGTVVGLITINGGETPGERYTISCRGPLKNGSYLSVPFTVKDNMLVTTESLTASSEPWAVTIVINDKESNEKLTSTFNVSVVPLRTIAAATSMKYDRTTGDILIKTRNNTEYRLESPNGAVIAQGSLSPVPHISFKKSDLAEGRNKLVISSGSDKKEIYLVR